MRLFLTLSISVLKVRDFLPVRNAYNEVGLLDRVSGELYSTNFYREA
jgi:hypothetical protein